jgi:ribose transport system ATP-binding protein
MRGSAGEDQAARPVDATASTGYGPAQVTIRGLTKRFGAATVLDAVDLTLRGGQVHALLGQNGAGKSTLIKILSGYHTADGGEVEMRADTLRFVHQDIGIVPTLSITENLHLGHRFPRTFGRRISWRRAQRRAEQALAFVGLESDPRTEAGALSQSERTLVAIARALSDQTTGQVEDVSRHVIVLDEPTATLPGPDVARLLKVVRDIAARGAGVLYVTHRLEEVLVAADHATVIRDGQVVASTPVATTTHDELVRSIVGHDLGRVKAARSSVRGASGPIARLSGVSGDGVEDVSLTVEAGEVLGLSGLVGSGLKPLAYLIAGITAPRSGAIEILGAPARKRLGRALYPGVAVVAEDRIEEGGIQTFTVRENVTLSNLSAYRRRGGFAHRRERARARQVVDDFEVVPADPDALFARLSGGNQKKVLLARALEVDPALLVLLEPTAGLDPGTREAILGMLRDRVQSGAGSVVFVSTDYESMESVCDRVLIVRDGRILLELAGSPSRHEIAEACYA